MGVRRAWLLIAATAALGACEFPRPADVGPPGDGNAGDDGGGSGDGSGDGGGTPKLSTFTKVAGVTLRVPRSFHSHAILGNQLTVFGGISDVNLPTSNEQAAIMANDVIGNFAIAANNLHDGGTGFGIAALPTALYVLGGEIGSGDTTDEQQRALLGGSSFGSFTVQTARLATTRTADGVLVTPKNVYVFGGVRIVPGSTTHLSSVERGAIGTGDVLTSFSNESTLGLVGPNTQFATVVVGNFIYVIGGSNGAMGAAGVLDTVQRAPINVNGTMGTFSDTGNHLVVPRLSHAAVVLGDSVYVIGGRASGDGIDSVERAVIMPNGSLGPFTLLTDVKLAAARYGHTADVVGNSIYVTGGQTDVVTTLDTVERAQLK